MDSESEPIIGEEVSVGEEDEEEGCASTFHDKLQLQLSQDLVETDDLSVLGNFLDGGKGFTGTKLLCKILFLFTCSLAGLQAAVVVTVLAEFFPRIFFPCLAMITKQSLRVDPDDGETVEHTTTESSDTSTTKSLLVL
jgi:hypothetical protein